MKDFTHFAINLQRNTESRDALKGARPVRREVSGVQHVRVVRWSLTLHVIEDQETCWFCAYSRPNNPQEKKVALAIIQRARETNSPMLELIETWLVAGIRPDNIEALASASGHTNSEYWPLVAEYFYD